MDNKKIINIAEEVMEARGFEYNLKDRLNNEDKEIDNLKYAKKSLSHIKDLWL